ncbi:MAG: YtxH domain-containing protein [Nitriliruptoraceae bacterium]
MRLRTILTIAVGATLGAGVMYLLDPVSGEQRRREVRRDVARCVREGALVATKAGIDLAHDVSTAALDGYRQARQEMDPPA